MAEDVPVAYEEAIHSGRSRRQNPEEEYEVHQDTRSRFASLDQWATTQRGRRPLAALSGRSSSGELPELRHLAQGRSVSAVQCPVHADGYHLAVCEPRYGISHTAT